MKYLSIDIGIINLAYCIMDTEKNVYHWEVFSLCNGTEIENTKDLIKKFDERPHIFDVDKILIERQPKINPKMRIFSEAVRSYFIMRGLVDKNKTFKIINYSPKHKLKCYDGPIPDDLIITEEMRIKAKKCSKTRGLIYRITKKLGKYHCVEILKGYPENISNIYNNAQSKKDDLADCFLQVLSYIMYEDNKKNKDTSSIIQRAPTSKQSKYKKYSKNNLKYLLIQYLSKNTYEKNKGIETFMNLPESKIDIDEILDIWISQKDIEKNINRLYSELDKDEKKKNIKDELVPEMFLTKFYKSN